MTSDIMTSDIKRFEAGEVPSPFEISQTPRLEHWALSAHRRMEKTVLRANGIVHGHPDRDKPDGTTIQTGPLVYVDRRMRFARSQNRLYVLGEHAGDPIPVDGVDL